VDENETIVECTRSFVLPLLGYKPNELIGLKLSMVLPSLGPLSEVCFPEVRRIYFTNHVTSRSFLLFFFVFL